MKKFYKNASAERTIIVFVWIYAAIVIAALYLITSKWVLPLSFLLGVFTNLMCFTMTIRTVDKIFKYDEVDKKRELIKNNVSKYLIYLIVLALAGVSYYFHKDQKLHLDIIATACGFLSVKVMIYFKYFIFEPLFMKGKQKSEDSSIIKPNSDESDEESLNKGDEDV